MRRKARIIRQRWVRGARVGAKGSR